MAERIRAVVPVFIFLQTSANEVYLQKRQNTGYKDGWFDTPSGKTDIGESPQDAAVREAMEEAGITINPQSLELFHTYMNVTDEPWLGLMFRTREWEGVPTINEPDKCSQAGFYALEALPSPVTQQVQDALARIATAPSIDLLYYTDI